MMTIQNVPGFGFPLLRVGGTLDFAHSPGLLSALRKAQETGPRRIALDLHEVEHADLTGMALLLTASEWLAGRGTELRIVGVSPAVAQAIADIRRRAQKPAGLDGRVRDWLAGDLRIARAS